MSKSLRLKLLSEFVRRPKQFARDWANNQQELATAREALRLSDKRKASLELSLTKSQQARADNRRRLYDDERTTDRNKRSDGLDADKPRLKEDLYRSGNSYKYDRARDLKSVYEEQTWRLQREHPEEEAMSLAVGGDFEAAGRVELAILQKLGLQADNYLIDVGCGSGRLAKPLTSYLSGHYSGFDIVADLVEYAQKICGRPDWRFGVVDQIEIPEPDNCADMVCFFSVLTHLLHEQSYWYLEEAIRVAKPGGAIVFSFLDFDEPSHWPVFLNALENFKQSNGTPLDVFMSKEMIKTWSTHLSVEIERFVGAEEAIAESGALGQSICMLRKR